MLNFTPLDKAHFFEPNYLKKQVAQNELTHFKTALQDYLKKRDDKGSESNHQGTLLGFFKELNFEVQQNVENGGGGSSTTDLALFYEGLPQILFELKKPSESKKDKKDDMFSPTNVNCKALHEAILYYFREKKIRQNFKVKFIIITNFYHFYVFDYKEFDRIFDKNSKLKAAFDKYKLNTAQFYASAQNVINELDDEIKGFCLDLTQATPNDETTLNLSAKLFHKDFLFSLFSEQDANEINEAFYKELLSILGLDTQKSSEGTLIVASGEPDTLYHAIKITLENLSKLTSDEDKDYENAMSLIILWLNRILFLKLVEANLLRFNKAQRHKHRFLTREKVPNFAALNKLFFSVFAKEFAQRKDEGMSVSSPEFALPYLNSSLFELNEREERLCRISDLVSDISLKRLLDFLNRYDFSSGDENATSETIINASILGKIFERFNGYKDGSVFTKNFVTSYMCQNAIEKVVLQKFSELGLNALNLGELKQQIRLNINADFAFKQKAICALNSIRICDPAVGSGHFLVSALNEMLRVFWFLGLSELEISDLKLANDEITITLDSGELFEYHKPQVPSDSKHKIQKTLFALKRQIIENNLFGVDINPNSVEICKLRLWIELLKNSYYLFDDDEGYDANFKDAHQMQTLPNIDINIKSGNSLLNIIATQEIDESGKVLENSVQWHRKHNAQFSNNFNAQIAKFNALVQEYKSKMGKKDDLRKQMQEIKENLKQMLCLQPLQAKFDEDLKAFVENYGEQDLSAPIQDLVELYKHTDKRSEWKQHALFSKKPSKAEINKIEKSWQNLQNAKQDSIEWRYEFPEILNLSSPDTQNFGDFIGFDLVIGNPPYIRQEDIPNKERILNAFNALKLKSGKSFANSTADILTYFFPKGISVLKNGGILSLIVSNKFCRAGYGANLREYLLENTSILDLVDLNGFKAFDGVTVDTLIISCRKEKANSNSSFFYATIADSKPKTDKTAQNSQSPTTSSLRGDKVAEAIHNAQRASKSPSLAEGDLGGGLSNSAENSAQNSQNPKERPNLSLAALPKTPILQTRLNKDGFLFLNDKEWKLKDKIEKMGKPLAKWDISMFRGIITGLNEAFVIDTDTKDNILKSCKDKDEKERTEALIKPTLRGENIKRYSYEWTGLWIILAKFDSHKYLETDYPTIYKHLLQYKDKLQARGQCRYARGGKADTGKDYSGQHHWLELDNNPKDEFLNDFEKPKLIWAELGRTGNTFAYDENKFFTLKTAYIMTGENLKYLLGVLNSKLVLWYLDKSFAKLDETGWQWGKANMEQIPIPQINSQNSKIVGEIINLVDKILEFKKQSKNISEFEMQIDILVYKIYNLSDNEIIIINEV